MICGSTPAGGALIIIYPVDQKSCYSTIRLVDVLSHMYNLLGHGCADKGMDM